MAINYSVQAEVVDINSDTPKAEDVFLVDTNVWYWMTYPNATRLCEEYPRYVDNALKAKSTIHHSGLSLAELTHLIEKTERDIYCQYVADEQAKEYRHNETSERSRIVSEIQSAWSQVLNLASPIAVAIDAETSNAALKRLETQKVDGYDLFILESMMNSSIVQVITDDGDFSTVPGIQIFTANRNVIKAAQLQKKLISR